MTKKAQFCPLSVELLGIYTFTPMSIEEKDKSILERFQGDDSWEDRYARIIKTGKDYDGLSESEKNEDLLVKGCQSQVWIKADLSPEKTILFQADSDAMIVKGLVALLVELFSGEKPSTVSNYKPQFIEQLGLGNHLSPSRANGLNSMMKQMKFYAVAYSALE